MSVLCGIACKLTSYQITRLWHEVQWSALYTCWTLFEKSERLCFATSPCMALFNYLMFYFAFMLFALQFLEAARRHGFRLALAPWHRGEAWQRSASLFLSAKPLRSLLWSGPLGLRWFMLQELPNRTKASGVDRLSSWNLGVSKQKLELMKGLSPRGGHSARFFINWNASFGSALWHPRWSER